MPSQPSTFKVNCKRQNGIYVFEVKPLVGKRHNKVMSWQYECLSETLTETSLKDDDGNESRVKVCICSELEMTWEKRQAFITIRCFQSTEGLFWQSLSIKTVIESSSIVAYMHNTVTMLVYLIPKEKRNVREECIDICLRSLIFLEFSFIVFITWFIHPHHVLNDFQLCHESAQFVLLSCQWLTTSTNTD
jgi:hypothetical protein